MTAKPLILPHKLLVAMIGVSIAMIIGVFYSLFHDLPINESWIYIALVLAFIPLLAIVKDLTQNPIAGKFTWALFLAIVPFLAILVYLIGRDKILEKSNLKK